MPVGRHIQTSLASGEFDPLLWSREDVSFFYNSARVVENAIPLPQGGVKRREGWRHRALQRGPLSAVNLGAATITAANGGTVANLTDGDEATVFATNSIGTATEFEVFRLDFGAVQGLSMLDALGLHIATLPSGTASVMLTVQHSFDGAAWIDAHSVSVGSTPYDRRFAAKPDTRLGVARYWRLIVDNPTAIDLTGATVEVSEIAAQIEAGYSDAGAVGEFSIHRLTPTSDDEYILVLTAGCGDVFLRANGAWVASVAIPHTDGEVRDTKSTPNLDTLILYHKDQPPWFIQRLGVDADWHSGALAFDTVTEFPFDEGDVSGGENEIQFIRFDAMAAGNKLIVEYNGETSSEVVWSNVDTDNATNLEAAIESLPDIASVSVTVSDGSGANADLEVEFTGDDGKKPWPILVVDVLTGSGTATLSHKQYGRRDFDTLWNATRGYPRCGTFYQGRHWMGGFLSRPDLIVGSRAGSLFDFKEDADPVAGSPIVIAPNIDDQVTVLDIYPGRHLQIFTSSAEMYVPDEPITIDNIALKVTSRHGTSGEARPVDVQGGTLFVDKNGRALREYLFTDTEQSYTAEPVSLLAGHLMSAPRSMARRRARDVDEPNLLMVANTGQDRDGNDVPAAMVVIDRAQQVTGFFRVKTDGTPLGFAATQSGEAFVMVERQLAGVKWNHLEQFDGDAMSDCSTFVSGSGSTVDLSGSPWLEGQAVEVHGDGLPLGQFTVSGGVVDLGDASYSAVAEAGLRQVPRIVLHPYKGRGDISPTMQNMRIFRALLELERTGAVAITAHDGGRPRKVSLQNYDSGTLDPILEEVLFSGPKRIGGLGKWQKEPVLEYTQIEPMPFLVRSVSYDVRF